VEKVDMGGCTDGLFPFPGKSVSLQAAAAEPVNAVHGGGG